MKTYSFTAAMLLMAISLFSIRTNAQITEDYRVTLTDDDSPVKSTYIEVIPEQKSPVALANNIEIDIKDYDQDATGTALLLSSGSAADRQVLHRQSLAGAEATAVFDLSALKLESSEKERVYRIELQQGNERQLLYSFVISH